MLDETRYLNPSPLLRELSLLECLDAQPHISQSALAARVGLTPAMVNTYIKRFQEFRWITTESISKGMAYHLTDAGRHRLNYHRITFRAELVSLTREARSQFREFFARLAEQGQKKIILYGAGETADVALDALEGTHFLTVLAVIDDDPAKQGRHLHGVPVLDRGRIASLQPDAVVITSALFSQAIHARLEADGIRHIPILSLTD